MYSFTIYVKSLQSTARLFLKSKRMSVNKGTKLTTAHDLPGVNTHNAILTSMITSSIFLYITGIFRNDMLTHLVIYIAHIM